VKQGAHLTKPGWSKPHTHSNPTNLALFRHKESLDDLLGKKFNTWRVYAICLGRRTESSYCRAMCMLELLMLKALNVTFCLFRVAIFLSQTLMQSFTVCVMIGVSTDIFLFLSVFYLYFFLLFSILFRFYLCTVCTIFIIIIIIIIIK